MGRAGGKQACGNDAQPPVNSGNKATAAAHTDLK